MNKISINNPYFITQLIEGNHNAYETLFHLYFEKLHYVAVSYIENTEDCQGNNTKHFFEGLEKETDTNS